MCYAVGSPSLRWWQTKDNEEHPVGSWRRTDTGSVPTCGPAARVGFNWITNTSIKLAHTPIGLEHTSIGVDGIVRNRGILNIAHVRMYCPN